MEKITRSIFNRLYGPVGEIITQWGITDIAMHYLGFSMYKRIGTSTIKRPWPVMFGNRLSIVETMFKKRAEFASLADEAAKTIKDLKHQQKLRDILVHGAAVRYDKEKDAVLFRRLDPTTKKQRLRNPEITHRQHQMLVRFSMLKIASGNCAVINRSLLSLQERIAALPSPE